MTLFKGGFATTVKSCRNTDNESADVFEPLVPVTVMFEGLALVADRPVTVMAVLCPAVMVVGLNEQVTPEEHARLMLEVKLAAASAVIVKLVEVAPITTLLE